LSLCDFALQGDPGVNDRAAKRLDSWTDGKVSHEHLATQSANGACCSRPGRTPWEGPGPARSTWSLPTKLSTYRHSGQAFWPSTFVRD